MNPYISLAKEAVETYIEKGEVISPPNNLPGEFLNRRAGIFVTIVKNGELRGCIGTYLPTKINIAEEIIRNAVAAAAEDYRFNPIQKRELSSLLYTVYVLNYPEQIKDIKELDVKKFGIIVKTTPFVYPNEDVKVDDSIPSKTGLLLPDLPEVDTVEKQFIIACQKGDIDPSKDKIIIYRFKVEKYS